MNLAIESRRDVVYKLLYSSALFFMELAACLALVENYYYTIRYDVCMCTVLRVTMLGCFCCNTTCIQAGTSEGTNGEMNAVNCSNTNTSLKALSNCSLSSWSTGHPNDRPGSCTAENYTGSVCRPQLLLWQDCSAGSREHVLLDLTLMEHSQEEREKDVAQFLHLLRELEMALVKFTFIPMQNIIHAGYHGSDHCQRAAGMLVCQSYFPFCDKCQRGHSYLASREDCERVSIVECEEEWAMARQYGIPLPNCTDLPEQLIGENYRDMVKTF